MKKLWIRWVVLVLFVTALAVTFVQLGEWQLHRLDQRRDRNAAVLANQAKPVVDWRQVFGDTVEEDEQWQRVTITGTYLPQHQLEVRYRNVGGEAGSEWVVPIQTADGGMVLVNRGFTPRDAGTVLEAGAPPGGEVTVEGFVRRNERGKDSATVPVQGSVRLINAPAIATELDLPLADGYIQLISSEPPTTGLTPVGLPETDEGPHLSYAIQWFLFTAVAVIGCVLLVRADLRERRRRRERAQALREELAGRTSAGGGAAPDEQSDDDQSDDEQLGGEDPREDSGE
ncbi:SURF1 family protein [Propionibacteriaceae bacterium Y1923]|uniref:SURF1 family cytochrome oxidase biogenesis protein n=1 Tax=Aestuariimicrobium sp. Y1814 TaxID=3418742 RepID=UPI003C16EB89